MSSTPINNANLLRSNAIQTPRSVRLPDAGNEVASHHGTADVMETSGSTHTIQSAVSANPHAAGFEPTIKPKTVTVSNKVGPTDEHAADVKAEALKGISVLTRAVAAKTSGARAATKYTTVAGIGLAFGLLFAGQPFAVMLVAPAFAALGTIIAYVMRSYQNNKADASIDAFKQLMLDPSEETKNSPEFAEAQKLNAFLTDSYKTFAKKELIGLVSGFKNPLAGLSAKLAEMKAAQQEQNSAGVDENRSFTETDGSVVSSNARTQIPLGEKAQSAVGATDQASIKLALDKDNISEEIIDPDDSISNVGRKSAPAEAKAPSVVTKPVETEASKQKPVEKTGDSVSDNGTQFQSAHENVQATVVG